MSVDRSDVSLRVSVLFLSLFNTVSRISSFPTYWLL
jgi:hypothetical protein